MEGEEIEVVISPEGFIEIKVQHIPGKKCVEATKALEQALGEVQRRQYTSEYYQAVSQTTRHQEKIKTQN